MTGKKPTSARNKSLAPPEPEEAEGPAQAPLLPDMPPAKAPEPIQNGRIVAEYVDMKLVRGKGLEELINLYFSFHLTKQHEKHVPERVIEGFKWITKTHNGPSGIQNIGNQTVTIYETPDADEPTLHLSAGKIVNASVPIVEETGKGKSKRIVRFSFRIQVDRLDDVIEFANHRDGDQFWITMQDSQMELEVEEEEEE